MQATSETHKSETYKSEFGWTMKLPAPWKRLTRRNPDDYAPLAVFSTPEDWSLSLSWMINRFIADDETLIAFDTATMMSSPLSVEEGARVASKIFPLLGEVVRANVVTLADGKKALEIIEIICSDDLSTVKKVAYSLVLPRRQRGEYRNQVHFQRLSFISTPKVFHARIQEVAKIARSFQYATMVA